MIRRGQRFRRIFMARSRHAPRRRGIQYAAAFEGNNNCHGVLDHPLSRMIQLWVQRITNKIVKILAFMVVRFQHPS
jgi:hypothetical protein